MKVICQNDFGKAWYNEKSQVLIEKYTGRVKEELAMEVVKENMAFGEKHQVKGILADLTETVGTFTKVNEFLEKVYFPFFMERGAKGVALAVSKDVFTLFAAKDLIKRLPGFEIQIFDGLKKAQTWIEERSRLATNKAA